MDKFSNIADNYNLKVVYDAAHAFGVECHCESLLRHGDLSVLSFHATKVFNTFEGGAIVCNDLSTKRRIDRLKNFGFVDEDNIALRGLNGKMNEFSALVGIQQLKYIDDQIKKRKVIYERYINNLKSVTEHAEILEKKDVVYNYAYMPVLFKSKSGQPEDELRNNIYEFLKRNKVYSRKYFYPMICEHRLFNDSDQRNFGQRFSNAFARSRRILAYQSIQTCKYRWWTKYANSSVNVSKNTIAKAEKLMVRKLTKKSQ